MNRKLSNIIIVGPMGAGKTTTGKQLGKYAGMIFYDSDVEIVKRSGVEISWIFEQEGEEGFRRREHDILLKMTEKQHIVLATGGGCLTTPANTSVLKENGVVVYLKVGLEKQLERISVNAERRPVFAANATKDKLEKLNRDREPLYEAIADLTYLTDFTVPQQLAKKIYMDYQKFKRREKK